MLNKRVHILFDKDLWNKLNKLAKLEKISLGELIRRAVKVELEQKKELLNKKVSPFKGLFRQGRK